MSGEDKRGGVKRKGNAHKSKEKKKRKREVMTSREQIFKKSSNHTGFTGAQITEMKVLISLTLADNRVFVLFQKENVKSERGPDHQRY